MAEATPAGEEMRQKAQSVHDRALALLGDASVHNADTLTIQRQGDRMYVRHEWPGELGPPLEEVWAHHIRGLVAFEDGEFKGMSMEGFTRSGHPPRQLGGFAIGIYRLGGETTTPQTLSRELDTMSPDRISVMRRGLHIINNTLIARIVLDADTQPANKIPKAA